MNRTVERAMQILQIVSKNNKGTTLQEIADALGIPKSSAYVIVQTLLAQNYLAPMRYNEKKYRIGLKLFTLGMRYVDDLNLVEQCALYLNPLADKYHKTAFVGVLEGNSVVYIHKYVSKDAMLASCALGSRKEVHATALGKAILAFSDDETRDKILESIELNPLTANTITDRTTLLEELHKTRQRGYSTDIKEHLNTTVCCGAPIFDYTGEVIAAISLSDVFVGPIEEMGEELALVARTISQSLGYNSRSKS